MHELALAQSICETVADHLEDDQRLVAVVIEWGPLSGVVPESLEFCFPIVAEHAGFAGARLEIRRLVAAARCPECDEHFEAEQMWAECPRCGHMPVTVSGGREFRLSHIEVEEEQADV